MTDLRWILRPMLFSTNEQAYITYLYFMKWWGPGFANAYSLEVLIQTFSCSLYLARCVPVLVQCHELRRLGSLLPLVQWLAFCWPNYVAMIYNIN